MIAIVSILVFVFCTSTVGADDAPKKPLLIQGTPAQQMEAVKRQYQEAQKACNESMIANPTTDLQVKAPIQGRLTIIEIGFDSEPYFRMMLKIAKDHSDNPARLDGLSWVFMGGSGNSQAQAAELIFRDHLMDPGIGDFCIATTCWTEGWIETANALRIVNAKHPNREVRAIAGFFLAEQLLFRMVEKAKVASEANAKERWKYQNWFSSPAEEEKYKKLKPDELEKEACRLFEAVIADPVGSNIIHPYCKDLDVPKKKIGDLAAERLFEFQNLRPGRVAPELVGEDIQGKPMKLSDFRGKVVVLQFGETWRDSSCREIIEDWYIKRGIVYIGVNVDRDRANLKKTIENESVPWRSFWDGDKDHGKVSRQWLLPPGEVGGLHGFIIDHHGKIFARLTGDEDRMKLGEAVKALEGSKR